MDRMAICNGWGGSVEAPITDRPIRSTRSGSSAGSTTPTIMSDQNKQPDAKGNSSTQQQANHGKQEGQRADGTKPQGDRSNPGHEQGREHEPNMNARKGEADTERASEHGQMQNTKHKDQKSTADNNEGRGKGTIVAGEQNDRKAGNEPVEQHAKTNKQDAR